MSDKGLLEIANQLLTDRDFRERLLVAPQDVLADLGLSAETYRALMAVVPVLLAGGVVFLAGGPGDAHLNGSDMGWGRG
jgi:hypothetical protein